jgi:hypothetical protein
MAIRACPQLLAFLSLFLAGAAFAQVPGNTSGPASGDNVKPSTAIQKENSGRSRSGIRSRWFISGGLEGVLAFLPWAVAKEFADAVPERFDRPFEGLSQECL